MVTEGQYARTTRAGILVSSLAAWNIVILFISELEGHANASAQNSR